MDLNLNCLKIQTKYGTPSIHALKFQNPCNRDTLELLHNFSVSETEFKECYGLLSTTMKVPV